MKIKRAAFFVNPLAGYGGIINIENKESKKCGERYGQSQNVIIGHGYYGIQQNACPEIGIIYILLFNS